MVRFLVVVGVLLRALAATSEAAVLVSRSRAAAPPGRAEEERQQARQQADTAQRPADEQLADHRRQDALRPWWCKFTLDWPTSMCQLNAELSEETSGGANDTEKEAAKVVARNSIFLFFVGCLLIVLIIVVMNSRTRDGLLRSPLLHADLYA
eukprot:TRINITY_DN23181_c0_g1_i1.p2 TRINITY_DN23181_c0_g1~~TRINITY_DN23181_c0_g1_i1.p2  ORF type:complete len:175 (+),score=38.63 TRINITY_DN23181_c0_g1_i1:72-527(+)